MIQFSSAMPVCRALPPQPVLAGRPQFAGGVASADSDGIPDDHFYPPKPNKPFLWAVKRTLNALLRSPAMDFKVVMSEADKKRLHDIVNNGKDGVIATGNHAHLMDALTLIEVSRQAKVNLTVMGAIEFFETHALGKTWAFPAPILQAIGGFSVNRGAKDKSKSLDTAKQVVADGHLLGMLPEGHVTWSNQHVTDYKLGAFQVATSVVKNDKNVQIVPMAFFYNNKPRLDKKTQKHLAKLEKQIADRLGPQGVLMPLLRPDASITQRAERLFNLVVAEQELRHGIRPETSENPHDRLESLIGGTLTEMEDTYLGKPMPGNHETRTRRLISAIFTTKREAKQDAPPEKRRLFSRQPKPVELDSRLVAMGRDIEVLENLLGLNMYHRGYLREGDHNRLAEELFKLDRDITGDEKNLVQYWRNMTATVRVLEPVDVGAFIAQCDPAVAADPDRLTEALGKEVERRTAAEIEKLGRDAVARRVSSLKA